MNLIMAILLQADDMGKKATVHTPGTEGTFSRVMIVIFIVTLAAAAGVAIWMVCRGAAGATKAHIEKKEKNENQTPTT